MDNKSVCIYPPTYSLDSAHSKAAHHPTSSVVRGYDYAAKLLLATLDSKRQDIVQWAILDSGASSHYLLSTAPTKNKTQAISPIRVHLPNGDSVTSSHTCELDLPQLPLHARMGHVVPGLAGHSLVSVVRLCNAGCKVMFKDIGVEVTYKGKIVICGQKDTRTGLWMIPLTATAQQQLEETSRVNPTSQEQVGNVHDSTTRAELVEYHHQSLFAPPASTIEKAIANHQLDSFPGLTPGCTRLLPPSTATYKGHMKLVGKGARSTRSLAQDMRDARTELKDMNPTDHVATVTDKEIDFFCYAALADANEGTVYTDLTGRFPTRSYAGSQYIFVCYAYQPNAVLI